MRALLVVLREYVEEERLDIVVERLVVEKELGEQTQVLTIDFGRVAVHLENGEVSRRRAVYFVAGWTERWPDRGRGAHIRVSATQLTGRQIFNGVDERWGGVAIDDDECECKKVNEKKKVKKNNLRIFYLNK